MNRSAVAACAMVLAVLLFLPSREALGQAEESTPPLLPPSGEEAPEVQPLQEQIISLGRTVEETHDQLEQDILEQIIRFDDFFGNVKSEEQRKTRYHLRWRNSLRVGENGDVQVGTTIRANLVLSGLSDRLKIAISGEDERTPTTPSLPEDPGSPGFDRTSRNVRLANTELRYSLIREHGLDLFLGAGFRLAIPLEGFVRSRFLYSFKLSDVILIRFGETLFINNTIGLGETTEVSLERLLDKETLVRWANSGTVSQKISGMEWGSELSVARQLSPKSAVTLVGGVYGNTSASELLDNHKIYFRYRRNFLRPWLFYELEPEVSWPRNKAGQYLATYALTGRIEIVFQGDVKDRTTGSWP